MSTNLTSKFRVIGAMSGTSLDGLDLALTEFKNIDGIWAFDLIDSTTIAYSSRTVEKLSKATSMSAAELTALDKEFGQLIGEESSEFLKGRTADFIASHGHTIFHQPLKNITLQIGCGSQINKIAQVPVIYDFRSHDVSIGGQGAPLVPIGDKLLFSNYDICLNLGGIANCSFEKQGQRLAYDIAPFNMVFNRLAEEVGKAYDESGMMAKSGQFNKTLYDTLHQIAYYQKATPKSLGIEDYEQSWQPLLNNAHIKVEDRLHTYAVHAANVIGNELNLNTSKESKLLITGGGTYNDFFIEELNKTFQGEIVIPSNEIIDFKEAIIFAFMGVLKYCREVNCLASVTGAERDSSTGVMLGF